MAVPSSDRLRQPFLLSLSLFLLISAILVLGVVFLDPSPGSLAFRPSRLSAASPSLPPPLLPQQQHHAPIPTPGSPPRPEPDGLRSADTAERSSIPSQPPPAKADDNSDASQPSATATGGGGGALKRPESNGGGGGGAAVRTGPSVVAAAGDEGEAPLSVRWVTCSRLRRGVSSTDYIPCLDNVRAIKALRSRRHMEHRERH